MLKQRFFLLKNKDKLKKVIKLKNNFFFFKFFKKIPLLSVRVNKGITISNLKPLFKLKFLFKKSIFFKNKIFGFLNKKNFFFKKFNLLSKKNNNFFFFFKNENYLNQSYLNLKTNKILFIPTNKFIGTKSLFFKKYILNEYSKKSYKWLSFLCLIKLYFT